MTSIADIGTMHSSSEVLGELGELVLTNAHIVIDSGFSAMAGIAALVWPCWESDAGCG
jgi:hypothetical protein